MIFDPICILTIDLWKFTRKFFVQNQLLIIKKINVPQEQLT